MDTIVTGGAGFIGSTLVDRLTRDGHRVHVIDNFSRGRRDNLAAAEGTGRCTVHELDVTSTDLTTVVTDVRPDVIFHLAAQIDVRVSVHAPLADAMVNVLGTVNVAEAARKAGVHKVVFASSGGAIYGAADALPAAEGTPLRPLSQYGAAKLAGEIYLNTYHELHGLDCTHLALANAYGPRQDHRGEAGVVAVFANALLMGGPTYLFGDGGNTRDYVYVDDIVEAFVLAAFRGRPACRYNIGTGVQTTDRALHSAIAVAVGAADQPEHRPARFGDVRASALDGSAARSDLGWTPRVDLAEGIRRTVARLPRTVAPPQRRTSGVSSPSVADGPSTTTGSARRLETDLLKHGDGAAEAL